MVPVVLRQLGRHAARAGATARRLLASPRGAVVVRWAGWAAVAVVLAWYLAMMWGRMGVYAGGSDSSGYANNAKLLLDGRFFAEQRRVEGIASPLNPYAYVPLGFMPKGETTMVPTYPLGLSALFAAAAAGTSLDRGMMLAIWLMTGASLVVTYLLARQQGLGRGWAVLAAGTLAACPLFLFSAQQAMSDMPALLWTTLALLLARASRRRAWLAALAGAAVALAVFIRPANALVLVPLGWALGADWRRWAWLALGGLPGGVVWLLTNQVLFGRYVATGYVGLDGLFSWRYVGPTLRNYAASLPWLLPAGVLLPFAFTRGAWPAGRRVALGMAVAWVAVVAGFYACYRYTHETWWYLRFILPVFPVVIALSVQGLRRGYVLLRGPDGRRPAWRVVLAAAALASAVYGGLRVQLAAGERWNVMEIGDEERVYPETCDWARQNLPANSVVFAMQVSGSLFYAGPHAVVRWDVLSPALSREFYAAAAATGRPVYAVLFPFEVEAAFGPKLAGRWTQTGAVRHVTIWRLENAAGSMP